MCRRTGLIYNTDLRQNKSRWMQGCAGDILFPAEQAGKQLSRGRSWWEQGFAGRQGWSRICPVFPEHQM